MYVSIYMYIKDIHIYKRYTNFFCGFKVLDKLRVGMQKFKVTLYF